MRFKKMTDGIFLSKHREMMAHFTEAWELPKPNANKRIYGNFTKNFIFLIEYAILHKKERCGAIMKYRINIRSTKNPCITNEEDLFECTKDVEATDRCDAVSLAMKEASADRIESKYLPLVITIEEIDQ